MTSLLSVTVGAGAAVVADEPPKVGMVSRSVGCAVAAAVVVVSGFADVTTEVERPEGMVAEKLGTVE